MFSVISHRDPEHSPEYSDFSYLYGSHWWGRYLGAGGEVAATVAANEELLDEVHAEVRAVSGARGLQEEGADGRMLHQRQDERHRAHGHVHEPRRRSDLHTCMHAIGRGFHTVDSSRSFSLSSGLPFYNIVGRKESSLANVSNFKFKLEYLKHERPHEAPQLRQFEGPQRCVRCRGGRGWLYMAKCGIKGCEERLVTSYSGVKMP